MSKAVKIIALAILCAVFFLLGACSISDASARFQNVGGGLMTNEEALAIISKQLADYKATSDSFETVFPGAVSAYRQLGVNMEFKQIYTSYGLLAKGLKIVCPKCWDERYQAHINLDLKFLNMVEEGME